jgi:hypothetical protein
VDGARDPNDPELNHEVGVVSRLKDKKMAQPYRKLKVPDSISHVLLGTSLLAYIT